MEKDGGRRTREEKNPSESREAASHGPEQMASTLGLESSLATPASGSLAGFEEEGNDTDQGHRARWALAVGTLSPGCDCAWESPHSTLATGW